MGCLVDSKYSLTRGVANEQMFNEEQKMNRQVFMLVYFILSKGINVVD